MRDKIRAADRGMAPCVLRDLGAGSKTLRETPDEPEPESWSAT
jgi:hypothetical protein